VYDQSKPGFRRLWPTTGSNAVAASAFGARSTFSLHFPLLGPFILGPTLPCPLSTPQALILAAGVGNRLGAVRSDGPHPPKVLLRFGGHSLLERHLGILQAVGIDDVTFVVGYGEAMLRDELAALPLSPPALVTNPAFQRGSMVSLHTGRAVLTRGAPVVLMDADVLYDRRMMARLLGSRLPNVLLLDRAIESGDEPVKICIGDGHIVDFHKRPRVPHDWHGESVGFFRLAPDTATELAERAAAYVAAGAVDLEYEEAIRDLILAGPPGRFGFEDITGLPWTEIDFPEDVTRAEALVPALDE
jgi:choline kinase